MLHLLFYSSVFLVVPASVEVLDEVEVEYITLPGWMTSIEHCRTFSELPPNAQAYIRKIEEITQIPGTIIIVLFTLPRLSFRHEKITSHHFNIDGLFWPYVRLSHPYRFSFVLK